MNLRADVFFHGNEAEGIRLAEIAGLPRSFFEQEIAIGLVAVLLPDPEGIAQQLVSKIHQQQGQNSSVKVLFCPQQQAIPVGDVGGVGALGVAQRPHQFFGLVEFCGYVGIGAIEYRGIYLGGGELDDFGRLGAAEVQPFEELLVLAQVILAEGLVHKPREHNGEE